MMHPDYMDFWHQTYNNNAGKMSNEEMEAEACASLALSLRMRGMDIPSEVSEREKQAKKFREQRGKNLHAAQLQIPNTAQPKASRKTTRKKK
jgi:type II secretory pathway component PulF